MHYGLIVCGQADDQRGGMHAELCGEVYGYESSGAEASGDIESRAVDVCFTNIYISVWSFREQQGIAQGWRRHRHSQMYIGIGKDNIGSGVSLAKLIALLCKRYLILGEP